MATRRRLHVRLFHRLLGCLLLHLTFAPRENAPGECRHNSYRYKCQHERLQASARTLAWVGGQGRRRVCWSRRPWLGMCRPIEARCLRFGRISSCGHWLGGIIAARGSPVTRLCGTRGVAGAAARGCLWRARISCGRMLGIVVRCPAHRVISFGHIITNLRCASPLRVNKDALIIAA